MKMSARKLRLASVLFGAFCLTTSLSMAQHHGVSEHHDGIIRENHGDLADADHAKPGSWDHVDEMALDLKKLSEELHDLVHEHLEGHPLFFDIERYAESIEKSADHLHDVAHEGGNLKHLQADVIELDEDVHRAQEVISRIGRFGVPSHHFDGAVRQTREVGRSMNAILHHLEDDLVALDPSYHRRSSRGRQIRYDSQGRPLRASEMAHEYYVPGGGYRPDHYHSDYHHSDHYHSDHH